MRVQVSDGEGFIESSECREVQLPSGERGVVWRGLAYALGEGDTIRIDGDAVAPSLCIAEVSASASALHQPSPSLAIIDGDGQAYVILQGSVADAEGGAARLKDAGITVHRYGRYLGDPVDGFVGDWFIRVAKPDQGDWRALVAATLESPAAGTQSPADAWALRCRLLETELEAARIRSAKLHERVSELGLKLAEADNQSKAEIDRLLEAVGEMQRQSPRPETIPELPSTLQSEPFRPKLQQGKLRDEVASVLKALLPRIDLVGDSVTFIVSELETRTHLYRALSQLCSAGAGMPANWKKLKGVPKWWERHVSTGQSDAGRIYACLDQSSNHWLVLVSHKGDQSRDIAWLTRTS
jgi:hypothetical protein